MASLAKQKEQGTFVYLTSADPSSEQDEHHFDVLVFPEYVRVSNVTVEQVWGLKRHESLTDFPVSKCLVSSTNQVGAAVCLFCVYACQA